jgi:hypothetical protein
VGPAAIAAVEVKIDEAPGRKPHSRTQTNRRSRGGSSISIGPPRPGEHSIPSCAIDINGNVQPAMDDPIIANKKTYCNGQVIRHIRIG